MREPRFRLSLQITRPPITTERLPTMRRFITLCLVLAMSGTALAQSISIAPSDTPTTVLAALKGKKVTLRLQSGQELTGTVKEATDRLVLLGELSGREFFDGVVPVAAIEAVIVRTR